jgi:hypothetical protein
VGVRAGGKQLCCRFRPVLAELVAALAGENLAILALTKACIAENGTGRAQASTTKSFLIMGTRLASSSLLALKPSYKTCF